MVTIRKITWRTKCVEIRRIQRRRQASAPFEAKLDCSPISWRRKQSRIRRTQATDHATGRFTNPARARARFRFRWLEFSGEFAVDWMVEFIRSRGSSVSRGLVWESSCAGFV